MSAVVSIQEYVLTEDVIPFIYKAFPDASHSDLSRQIGAEESYFTKIKQQEKLRLHTADRILTQLDLNYLLSSGDIPIYSNADDKILSLEAALESEKKNKEIQKRRKIYWRQRAHSAEDALRYLRKEAK